MLPEVLNHVAPADLCLAQDVEGHDLGGDEQVLALIHAFDQSSGLAVP